jgi:predicted CXXCH cytochrome family protein
MRGGCYSRLKCIDCHSPHQALGARWTPKPDKDDAVCLKCHEQFQPATTLNAPDSARIAQGARKSVISVPAWLSSSAAVGRAGSKAESADARRRQHRVDVHHAQGERHGGRARGSARGRRRRAGREATHGGESRGEVVRRNDIRRAFSADRPAGARACALRSAERPGSHTPRAALRAAANRRPALRRSVGGGGESRVRRYFIRTMVVVRVSGRRRSSLLAVRVGA